MFQQIALMCLFGMAIAAHEGYNYHRATAVVTNDIGLSSIRSKGANIYDGSQPNTNLQKEFYYFSAPEEDYHESEELKNAIDYPKENLRVIFIKVPENRRYENAVLNLAKNAVQQKTHIYVLNKQPDIAGLAQKFQDAQSSINFHKPEVHFVKYNTAADAEYAQQTLKSHYDSLDGTQSMHAYGGVAPVNNFASSATSVLNSNQNREHSAAPAVVRSTSNVNREYFAPAIAGTTNLNNANLGPPPTAENTPVDKNYASKFLPSGSDVTPGSSYIPLLRLFRKK